MILVQPKFQQIQSALSQRIKEIDIQFKLETEPKKKTVKTQN